MSRHAAHHTISLQALTASALQYYIMNLQRSQSQIPKKGPISGRPGSAEVAGRKRKLRQAIRAARTRVSDQYIYVSLAENPGRIRFSMMRIILK